MKWTTRPLLVQSSAKHQDTGFCFWKWVWGEVGEGDQPAAPKIGQGAPPQPACWGTPPMAIRH